MQFLATMVILATVLTSALATPITINRDSPTEILKRDSINDCEDSSFQNDTSSGSPLVADCQQIVANIAAGGTWYLDATKESHDHTVVSFGTCIFGALSDWPTKIGNQDIIDLITTSVEQFQQDGRIGASGYVDCQNQGVVYSTNQIWWGIY